MMSMYPLINPVIHLGQGSSPYDFIDLAGLVTEEQIQAWGRLTRQLYLNCPKYSAMMNDFIRKTIPGMFLPDPEEWNKLVIIYNNIFAVASNEGRVRIGPFPVDLFTDTFRGDQSKLCDRHATKHYFAYDETSLDGSIAYLDQPFVQFLDSPPFGITDELNQLCMFIHGQCETHPETKILRLYKLEVMNDATGLINQASVAFATALPYISLDHFYQVQGEYQKFMLSKEEHHNKMILCKYCYPSMLGVVSHLLERSLEITSTNIPRAMRPVCVDYRSNIGEGRQSSFDFKKRADVLLRMINNDISHYKGSDNNIEQSSTSTFYNNVYKRMVYTRWSRIMRKHPNLSVSQQCEILTAELQRL